MNSGFRGFAFHPDFSKSARPGYRRFYTLTCETQLEHRSSKMYALSIGCWRKSTP
jgi:hypothetical protein